LIPWLCVLILGLIVFGAVSAGLFSSVNDSPVGETMPIALQARGAVLWASRP
jgi:hypothetical protein